MHSRSSHCRACVCALFRSICLRHSMFTVKRIPRQHLKTYKCTHWHRPPPHVRRFKLKWTERKKRRNAIVTALLRSVLAYRMRESGAQILCQKNNEENSDTKADCRRRKKYKTLRLQTTALGISDTSRYGMNVVTTNCNRICCPPACLPAIKIIWFVRGTIIR